MQEELLLAQLRRGYNLNCNVLVSLNLHEDSLPFRRKVLPVWVPAGMRSSQHFREPLIYFDSVTKSCLDKRNNGCIVNCWSITRKFIAWINIDDYKEVHKVHHWNQLHLDQQDGFVDLFLTCWNLDEYFMALFSCPCSMTSLTWLFNFSTCSMTDITGYLTHHTKWRLRVSTLITPWPWQRPQVTGLVQVAPDPEHVLHVLHDYNFYFFSAPKIASSKQLALGTEGHHLDVSIWVVAPPPRKLKISSSLRPAPPSKPQSLLGHQKPFAPSGPYWS